MKTGFAATVAAASIALGIVTTSAQAGTAVLGSHGATTIAQPSRIVLVDWGHHHCWWIKGRRVCRK
ncbi:hypothetical protein [Hyphomicrobium sp.]|uniref:hypothetical protein n=1 Tax=Hyphomicrobium sp. TaxID=82 RepID=UPI002CC8E63E|nr:hypothetical protein [Hyphomicrobium sp.]HVZ04030.1 hypothetical protein [Hyphomicrobium sp.]